MSIKPRNLPGALQSRGFTVSEALTLGFSEKELRHPRFQKPFRGVRSLAPLASVEQRAEAFAPALRPGEAFSHETALQLLGCPLQNVSPAQLHVTAPWPMRSRKARGVVGHASRRAFVPLTRPDGIRTVPALLALVQAAPSLSPREIIVAIDALLLTVLGSDPLLDPDSLRQNLKKYVGPGIRKLRWAAEFARIGAESRMETLLRLVLEAYGLAEYFELQVNLNDAAGWIGRFDLVSKRFRLVLEYDGEQHRTDRAQYLKDLTRLDRVRESGFRVIRVHAEQLLLRPGVVARDVASALGVEFVPRPRFPQLLV